MIKKIRKPSPSGGKAKFLKARRLAKAKQEFIVGTVIKPQYGRNPSGPFSRRETEAGRRPPVQEVTGGRPGSKGTTGMAVAHGVRVLVNPKTHAAAAALTKREIGKVIKDAGRRSRKKVKAVSKGKFPLTKKQKIEAKNRRRNLVNRAKAQLAASTREGRRIRTNPAEYRKRATTAGRR